MNREAGIPVENARDFIRKIAEGELASVAGGLPLKPPTTETAEGPGGCSSNYYGMECQATVEAGSSCYCTDYRQSVYDGSKR